MNVYFWLKVTNYFLVLGAILTLLGTIGNILLQSRIAKVNPANEKGEPIFDKEGRFGINILHPEVFELDANVNYSLAAKLPDDAQAAGKAIQTWRRYGSPVEFFNGNGDKLGPRTLQLRNW